VLLKILLLLFVALFVGRLIFAKKLKELGKVADHTLNMCIIAIAIYLALQAILFYGF